jgi:hypothetical protein
MSLDVRMPHTARLGSGRIWPAVDRDVRWVHRRAPGPGGDLQASQAGPSRWRTSATPIEGVTLSDGGCPGRTLTEPFRADVGPIPVKSLAAQIWAFCVRAWTGAQIDGQVPCGGSPVDRVAGDPAWVDAGDEAGLVAGLPEGVDAAVVVLVPGVLPGQPVEVFQRAVLGEVDVAADLDPAAGVAGVEGQDRGAGVGGQVVAPSAAAGSR